MPDVTPPAQIDGFRINQEDIVDINHGALLFNPATRELKENPDSPITVAKTRVRGAHPRAVVVTSTVNPIKR